MRKRERLSLDWFTYLSLRGHLDIECRGTKCDMDGGGDKKCNSILIILFMFYVIMVFVNGTYNKQVISKLLLEYN